MADLSYDVSVSTAQAEASLTKLQKTVGGLNDSFIRLKTTLASISLGAVISQSLQFADAISDLSDASEIAIGNLIGFQNAVMASGGSADGAQKAVLRLVNSIGEAADGSASMQQAFRDVGVTIDDLRNLSNQDILRKTIDGLDKMENSAKRSVLVTQLLGKEFRNVATGQLGAAYADATAKSAQYADAIAKGAAAQQNIDKTLGEFKIGVLEAIKPFTELISKVNIGVDNFQRFVQALLAVGAVLATVFVGGKIISGVRILWSVFVALFEAISGGISIIVNFVRNFGLIMENVSSASSLFSGLRAVISAVATTLGEVFAPAFGLLKTAAIPVLGAIAAGWGWIQESTGAAIDKLREYGSALTFGLISAPSGGGAGRGNGQAELDQRKKDADEAAKKEQALREVLDRQAEARGKVALELRHQIDNMGIGLSRQTESIALEARMIELSRLRNVISEDQVEIIKAQDDANNQRLAKLKDIEQQQEKLRFQLKYAKDEDKAGIEAQIGSNEQLRKKVEEYYAGHNKALDENITRLQTAKKLDAARIQDMENMKKSIEDQIARQQQLADVLRGINDQKVDLNFQKSIKGLSNYQKEVATIQESARKAALEAGRAYAAGFEDSGDGLTPERARELANGLNAIADGYISIANAQIEALGSSNDMIRGLTEAWDSYKASALDTAGQIKSSFENFTSGLEDAFVKFVQTGKLSFKDLANSILADLARIAVKKAIVGMASLFGFAAGGQVMADSPILVGERGPEMFVPRTAGTIVPNNALSVGSSTGEAAATNVTYNIQAVDAQSFRSMVARDPSFIYAVTEQGRRSQPTRRGM